MDDTSEHHTFGSARSEPINFGSRALRAHDEEPVPTDDDPSRDLTDHRVDGNTATTNARVDEDRLASDHDARLSAIIDAPLALGEGASAGFARKEHELGSAFAQLTIVDARALHKRLSNPSPGDAFAEKFARLVTDRRNRLLAFLADARRRAAVAARR